MRATLAELEEAERAYRKLRFTMICHAAFFFVCCVTAVVVRKAMGLPPALLGVVIIVALVVFGGDIMKFLASRERVRRLRTALNSSS